MLQRRDVLREGWHATSPSYPVILFASYLTGYTLGTVAALAWKLTRKVRPRWQ